MTVRQLRDIIYRATARARSTPQERTRARLRSYHKRRVELLRLIAVPGPNGGCLCAKCLREFSVEQLEVDHVDKITWDRYAMSPQMRVAKYHREFKTGVRLQAMCRSCNATDGNRRRWRRW